MDLTSYQLLEKIRHDLHAHPELSGEEYETGQKVASILSGYRPALLLEKIGGTGVIAIFDSGKPGPSVLFRSELDALPIVEINDFPHRSIRKNISHKCGHDGHTTILIGLAKKLSEKMLRKGKVILLFQPAEENGSGAETVMSDPAFRSIQPDYVFAFHNLPGYPLKQIVVKRNAFTASVKSIIIRLHGKTTHAAEPENGINPALAIARIIIETAKLSNNAPEKEDFSVVTPIHIHMGEVAYGTAAGYGEVHLTLRTWTEPHMKTLETRTMAIIEQVSESEQLKTEISWTNKFTANENEDEATEIVLAAAHNNNFLITKRNFPFKWGEDFGLFTQHFKGAMFGIGAGVNTPALHNADYDFPDELIPVGIQMFYSIAQKILE